MTTTSSIAQSRANNRTALRLIVAFAATVIVNPAASADVIYDFETLSATIDGVPVSGLTAVGRIDVTDAAVAAGRASVTTSNPQFGTPVETLTGINSTWFGFNIAPIISSSSGVINFAATITGADLTLIPDNLYGGFFVNNGDTDAYYAVGSADSEILTVGYGTDNPGSPCYGPQEPWLSHCVVTGEFVDPGGADPVPEPGALIMLFSNLALLGGALIWRRRAPPQRAGGGTRPA
jgi:hypothetical protein